MKHELCPHSVNVQLGPGRAIMKYSEPTGAPKVSSDLYLSETPTELTPLRNLGSLPQPISTQFCIFKVQFEGQRKEDLTPKSPFVYLSLWIAHSRMAQSELSSSLRPRNAVQRPANNTRLTSLHLATFSASLKTHKHLTLPLACPAGSDARGRYTSGLGFYGGALVRSSASLARCLSCSGGFKTG